MSMATVEWRPTKLDELGFVGRGKSRHRPRNAAILYGGRYPFFQTGDIKAANFYLTEYSQTYSEEGLAQSRLWKPGTLCITIAANIAESAILGVEGCFPDSVVGFVPDTSKADVRFIKYYLEILKLRMQNISHGSTQDNLSLDKLLSFDFLVPPLPIQRRIAGILSAYDELIENSQRRIKILESMARALYREWFVHFRFPGHESVPRVPSPLGEIPKGWEVKRLDQLAEIKGGKQLEKEDIHEVGEFPVFGGNGIQGYSAKATHRGFVIAFGRVGAYCGSIHWSYGGAWLNNNSSSVAPLKHDELVLHHLLDFHFDNLRGGAAQPFISNSSLAGIELVFPGESIAERFCSIVRPLRLQQVTVNSQVQNLRRTRDLLLPRLLSGQIDVEAMAS